MRYGNQNPYFVQPGGDFSHGLSGLADVLAYRKEKDEAKAKEEKAAADAEAARQEVTEAFRSGDLNRINEAAIKYPQLGDNVYKAMQITREDQKQRLIEDSRALAFAGSPQEFDQIMQNRIQGITDRGGDPTQSREQYEQFQKDPEGYMKKTQLMWAVSDPEGFKAWKEIYPEARKPESTQGGILADRMALVKEFGNNSAEVKQFDALVKSEGGGDSYTTLYDSKGNIVAQRNNKTGKVESDPRAAGGGGNAQVINIRMPDGSIKGFLASDREGIASALQAGGAEQGTVRDAGPQLSGKEVGTAKMKIQTAGLLKQQIAQARTAFDAIKNSLVAGPEGAVLGMASPLRQKFKAAIDALRSTTSALTRVPGVGAMSDYETRLDQSKIPNVNEFEGTTIQKLDQLEDLANFIESGYSDMLGGAAGNGGGNSGGNGGDIPAPDQREVGKVYDTPKGKMKWMGNGWQPAF